MNKSEKIKSLLSSFFDQVSPQHVQKARAVTGIGHLPRGSLYHLLDDQCYSLEDLVTLLLANTLTQQEELKIKSERIAELEDLCSHQQRAIDEIANQSLKLRSLIARLDPEGEAVSSFDLLKNIMSRVEAKKP